MNVLAVIAALALAVPTTVAAAPSGPGDAPPGCGDTVTGSVTLTRDLHCPAGSGLYLADGASLDLGGHTLSGARVSTWDAAVEPQGSASVRNGRLTGWSIGVGLPPFGTDAALRIEDLQIDRVRTGIGSHGFSHPADGSLTVDRVTVTDAERAVWSAWVSARVTDLTTRRVDEGVLCAYGACTVERSTFADGERAVAATWARVLVQDVRVTGHDRALFLASTQPGSVVQRSTLTDNREGVYAAGELTVRHNVLTRNTTGIVATDLFGRGRQQLVEGNVLRHNVDAIRAGASATVRGNLAVQNTGWGIYAPEATIGRGNVALGNGTKPQCLCGVR